ncbi:MAG TPA: TonB-dependent receptor [Gemmatimonadales bacterium]|nr:TonB-dependent receptor [Gemmatimonadales bacterium]
MKPFMVRRVLGTAVALLMPPLALTPLAAQQQAGTIVGVVRSATNDSVLPRALVSIEGRPVNIQADAEGRFRIEDVPAGKARISARLLGYAPTKETVVVPAGGARVVELRLQPAAVQLAELTVIGTNADLEERRARLAQIPGSVALIESAEIRRTRQANFKDVLGFTPGVYVQPRFGAADESQISIRGSGLRNNFHARGINILVNGMPYRNTDGFTDFESLELANTESIEVYKGGNALRYGGSTLGGAINLETKTGYTAAPLEVLAEGGSYGLLKTQIASGATLGKLDYYGSFTRTSLDGYRDYAVQGRDRVNGHLGYVLSENTDIRAFYFFARVDEQLPGALTASELASTPTAADPENQADRWGRNYDLHHLGLQLRAQLGTGQRLEISPYLQYRDIDHPIFRVINQQSGDYGAEARYENSLPLFGRTNRFTVGLQPSWLNMDHRQFVNEAGEHGDLQKDQKDEAVGLALYAENALALTSKLTAVAGFRLDHAIRKSQDHFLSDGDQSDHREFNPLLPKVGMLYAVPKLQGQVYANVSRSFEPPLLLELNSQTVPGFIDLAGQDAWQFELGFRGRSGAIGWDVAAYDVELENEILNINVQPFTGATFTVPTYRNAPRTRHYGLETGLEYNLQGGLFRRGAKRDETRVRLAYTFAQYRFLDDPDFEGNDIPGAPEHHLQAEVQYRHPSGFSLAPKVEWVASSYFINSANTASNQGWATFGLRAEYDIDRLGLIAFAAGENLTDTRYSASVQVDNAVGRSFEPADGRAVYLGLRWSR